MSRIFVAFLAFFFLFASSSFAEPINPMYTVNLDSVSRVVCAKSDGDGFVVGTAEVIGEDRIVTAGHVIYGTKWCSFNGLGTTVVYVDNNLDVAVLQAETGERPVMPVSCGGMSKGVYLSVGYADGKHFVVEPQLYGGKHMDFSGDQKDFPFVSKGLALGDDGSLFQGMSGGPVMNFGGRLVAINSAIAYGRSLFRDLKDTAICTTDGRKMMGLPPL